MKDSRKFLVPILLLAGLPHGRSPPKDASSHAATKQTVAPETNLSRLSSGGNGINWSGPYPACGNSAELLKRGHMDVGVRIAVADPRLDAEVRRALDFWSGVVDMNWHQEDNPKACALGIVDGSPELFPNGRGGGAQLPDWKGFQGLITLDPMAQPTATTQEMFRMAVHEIGHTLGLPHTKNVKSIMNREDAETEVVLDKDDLAGSRSHHALRPRVPVAPIKVVHAAENAIGNHSG